jgi:hypothetical protein
MMSPHAWLTAIKGATDIPNRGRRNTFGTGATAAAEYGAQEEVNEHRSLMPTSPVHFTHLMRVIGG